MVTIPTGGLWSSLLATPLLVLLVHLAGTTLLLVSNALLIVVDRGLLELSSHVLDRRIFGVVVARSRTGGNSVCTVMIVGIPLIGHCAIRVNDIEDKRYKESLYVVSQRMIKLG